jgi:hypothetical protein
VIGNPQVRKTMGTIKLVLWERHLAHRDATSVLSKAEAISNTPDYTDPDVEAATAKALKSYEEKELRRRLEEMGLKDRIPRKPKLAAKKLKREERKGPVLIDAGYIIEQAAEYGFKGLVPAEAEAELEAERVEEPEAEVVKEGAR